MKTNPFAARVTGEITVCIEINNKVLVGLYGKADHDTLRRYIEHANFYLNGSEICDKDSLKCVGEIRWGFSDIESMDFDEDDLIESFTANEDENV